MALQEDDKQVDHRNQLHTVLETNEHDVNSGKGNKTPSQSNTLQSPNQSSVVKIDLAQADQNVSGTTKTIDRMPNTNSQSTLNKHGSSVSPSDKNYSSTYVEFKNS